MQIEIWKQLIYHKNKWMSRSGAQLFLVDKHAAHERMIFERLLKEHKADKRARQQMLVPENVQLDYDEIAFALEHKVEFERIGFEIDAFGERQIALRSRPVCLTSESATDAFCEILTGWMRGGQVDNTERENHALKTVACKAAIKAGNINNTDELKKAIDNGEVDIYFNYYNYEKDNYKATTSTFIEEYVVLSKTKNFVHKKGKSI